MARNIFDWSDIVKRTEPLSQDLEKRDAIKKEIEDALVRQNELTKKSNLTNEEQLEMSSIKETVLKQRDSLNQIEETIKGYTDKDLYEDYMYRRYAISDDEYRHGVNLGSNGSEYGNYVTDLQAVGRMEKYFNVDNIFDEDGNLLIEDLIKEEEERLLHETEDYIKNPQKYNDDPFLKQKSFLEMKESLENVIKVKENGTVKKYNPNLLFDEDGRLKNIEDAFDNRSFYEEKDSNEIFKTWRREKDKIKNINNQSTTTSTLTQQETIDPKKRRRGNAGSVFKELNENSHANTAQNSTTSSSQQNASANPNSNTTSQQQNNTQSSATGTSKPKNQRPKRQSQSRINRNTLARTKSKRARIREQNKRKRLKQHYKKYGDKRRRRIPKDQRIENLRKEKSRQRQAELRAKREEIKNRRIEEDKRLDDQFKNLERTHKINTLEEDVHNLARHRKAEELKQKAYQSTILTTDERQELLDRAEDLKNGYDYDETVGRIESADKEIVEEYLERRQGVFSNSEDYLQFIDDINLTAKDYLDTDGNELGSVNKKINTSLRKSELATKGMLKGDFSDYEDYVEATSRLEEIDNRKFKLYDTDGLFNSNGNINNAEDLLNLKPSMTLTAKEVFDDWQSNQNYRKAPKINKTKTGTEVAKENVLRSRPNAKKLFSAQGVFGVGINLFNTVATYKEERKEGKGVISSAARAGIDFAAGELLGYKYPLIMLAESAPRMAVKGMETLGRLSREKNNMQRHEAFGYTSFQDTQQLATMRQSGMEMAKMANYNLQQTLMGNEAKYLHR